MRRHIAVLVIVSVALGLALGMVAATNGQDKTKFSWPLDKYPGHFQGAVNQGSLFLFDTTTGECWTSEMGHDWRRIVKPLVPSMPPRDEQAPPK
jgi:hypothetical protein